MAWESWRQYNSWSDLGLWVEHSASSCLLSLTPVLLGLQGAGVAHVAGGGRGPHVCLSCLLRREGHQKRREIFIENYPFSSGQSCWILVLPWLLLVGLDDPDYCGVSLCPPRSDLICNSRVKILNRILPAEMYFAVNQNLSSRQLTSVKFLLSSWCDIASLDLWRQLRNIRMIILTSPQHFTILFYCLTSLSVLVYILQQTEHQHRPSYLHSARLLDDHKNLLFNFPSFLGMKIQKFSSLRQSWWKYTFFSQNFQKKFYVVWAMCGWATKQ